MLESTPSKRKKPTSVGEYKKLSTQMKCAADAARNRAETYIGGAQIIKVVHFKKNLDRIRG